MWITIQQEQKSQFSNNIFSQPGTPLEFFTLIVSNLVYVVWCMSLLRHDTDSSTWPDISLDMVLVLFHWLKDMLLLSDSVISRCGVCVCVSERLLVVVMWRKLMRQVFQVSPSVDGCSPATSFHHLLLSPNCPVSKTCWTSPCVYLCVIGCVWTHADTSTTVFFFQLFFFFLLFKFCAWDRERETVCWLQQCLNKCVCVVPACLFVHVFLWLCLHVRKSAASSSCCHWWECDRLKDVAWSRKEKKVEWVRRAVNWGM